MKGITGFIVGFSLSLTSVSLGMSIYSGSRPNSSLAEENIHTKIDLFKKQDTILLAQNTDIFFADIKKDSYIPDEVHANIGTLPQAFDNDAPEDDEILSINVDGVIPIEYSDTANTQQAEILQYESDEELSAMLPTTIEDDNDADFADSNPWVITKGSRHIKNKQLLENISSQDTNIDITKGLTLGLQDTSEDSYKVAERIKSSLLFPIPSEILNDENLTPTFIKKSKKKEKPATNNLKLIPSTPKESAKEPEPNGLLNSISSWLSSDTNKNKDDNTQKNSAAPSYSSQGASIPAKAPSQLNNNEFVNFYKTLQETSAAQHSNSIIPSELKLSFSRKELRFPDKHYAG